jgi:DNA modification methylase
VKETRRRGDTGTRRGGEGKTVRLFRGDCLEVLRTLAADSVDAIVTDPPAGISFMGKAWDDLGPREAFIAFLTEVMKECLRVLKPGGHALVWAIPRTSHWTGMAIEDAGFEVRERIAHIFGTGFPKSLSVGKAIDREAGAKRKFIRENPHARPNQDGKTIWVGDKPGKEQSHPPITAPATDAAKQYDGFGTALKPAVEDWWLCRKPLSESTVARNVLKHGTGALNIDGTRIGFASNGDKAAAAAAAAQRLCHDQNKGRHAYGQFENGPASLAPYLNGMDKGRWPANLVLSHHPSCNGDCHPDCPVRLLNEQSGVTRSAGVQAPRGPNYLNEVFGNGLGGVENSQNRHGDSGGASRFFYCAKASRRDRNEGLEDAPKKHVRRDDGQPYGMNTNTHRPDGSERKEIPPRANHHPTVKNTDLMRWLIRLITPPGGTVLDCFMGSGSTGKAAVLEGMKFIGIERELAYFKIAQKRIRHAQSQPE